MNRFFLKAPAAAIRTRAFVSDSCPLTSKELFV